MTQIKKLDNELRDFMKLIASKKWEHTKVKFYRCYPLRTDYQYLGYNEFSNDSTTISDIIKQADEAYGKNGWNHFEIFYEKKKEEAAE